MKITLKDRSMITRVETVFRPGVGRTIAAIRSGSVDEEDLDKLNNFCMAALAMMSETSLAKYRYYQRRAVEIYNEELARAGAAPLAIDCSDDGDATGATDLPVASYALPPVGKVA